MREKEGLKHWRQYEGDETSEKQILAWLTDEETLKIIGVIDEVRLAFLGAVKMQNGPSFFYLMLIVKACCIQMPAAETVVILYTCLGFHGWHD